jgi:hypothetical protein
VLWVLLVLPWNLVLLLRTLTEGHSSDIQKTL